MGLPWSKPLRPAAAHVAVRYEYELRRLPLRGSNTAHTQQWTSWVYHCRAKQEKGCWTKHESAELGMFEPNMDVAARCAVRYITLESAQASCVAASWCACSLSSVRR